MRFLLIAVLCGDEKLRRGTPRADKRALVSLPPLDLDYLRQTLIRLLETPSPVGFTERGADLCVELLCEFSDLEVAIGRKGIVTAQWRGQNADAPRAVTAHIDTLGAVVSEIKPDGRLAVSRLGGFSWNTMENETVTLFTDGGAEYRGVIAIANASHHLYAGGNGHIPRDAAHMELRLDAPARDGEQLKQLGVAVGDFIAFDARPEWNHDWIRSRFLDDKALVACLLTATKALHDAGLQPTQNTTLHIPNYEEVGHGGATGISDAVHELLALDVAIVGRGQNSSERSCTLCARDADGPYDIKMRRRLKRLARQFEVDLVVDTFPEYCSDGDALWKSGADARVALIGPGVDATHGVERTHLEGLVATTRMVAAYLLDEARE